MPIYMAIYLNVGGNRKILVHLRMLFPALSMKIHPYFPAFLMHPKLWISLIMRFLSGDYWRKIFWSTCPVSFCPGTKIDVSVLDGMIPSQLVFQFPMVCAEEAYSLIFCL